MEVSEFKLIYPLLVVGFTDEQIGAKIRWANLLIDKIGTFGDMRKDALGLLAAHILALDKKSGGTGAVTQNKTSKRVGDVAFSLSTETGNRAWYGLTSFGLDLLMLIDMQPQYGGAFVV